MNKSIVGHVENTTKMSRKAQLESYDGCARLRPIWDDIASKYDAIITPSVVDEAPVGTSTGDAVSFSLVVFYSTGACADGQIESLLDVDDSSGPVSQHPWVCGRERNADRAHDSWASIH